MSKLKLKTWQIVTLAVGALIIVTGLFSYQIGLSASRGISGGKAAIITLGIVIAIVGVLGRKTFAAYKAVAIMLLNTILLLVFIEFSLVIIARLSDFLPHQSETVVERDLRYINDGREDLLYYQAQDWSKDYWREYHAAWDGRVLPFEPYVLWRSKPFEGKILNINAEGLRVTPGAECTPDSYTVFTFGGSTMWGTGVPDWGTIPAFLQSALAEQMGRPVCVINYAEQAWVSTQSVIQLMLALRAGNIPDLVIFYDGNNDVFAAYQSSKAGAPQNLSSIAARFEDRPEEPPLIALLSKTRTYKLLQRLVLGEDYKLIPPYEAQGVDANTLAAEVSQTYLGNYEIVQRLSSAYEFDAYFFWQTTLLVDEKQLTEEEQSIKDVAISVYPGYVELFDLTTEHVRSAISQYPDLHDLSGIFRDRSELIFIDPFHVTIEGNQMIASAMLNAIQGR